MKRNLLFIILSLFVSYNLWAKNTEEPNIIFILADDLGYGDLSMQGATDLFTPNIDKILGEGMRFTNFHSNSKGWSPSRAALLTGRFPDEVGVPGVIRQWDNSNFGYLSPSVIMLPVILQQLGYNAALMARHLGGELPNLHNDRGFLHYKEWLAGIIDDYNKHTRGGVNWLGHNDKEICKSRSNTLEKIKRIINF
ncbi:MAG: sulfatase-like hydrolase/transferase [Bacteroidetes bacterium]|nr:sulfatase-like hydrolase/transferase [Bacteroidota bacterium]